MTDEELAELEGQCTRVVMVHVSMVIPVIAALREARALAAERYEAAEEMHEALGEPSQRSPRTFATVVAERNTLRAGLAMIERDYADMAAERLPLVVENATLRAENERMRGVVDAACMWGDIEESLGVRTGHVGWSALRHTIDTYRAGGKP